MSWQDIESDADFQALPEDRRARVKENYFKDKIAPRVPAEHLESVRSSFLSSKPKGLASLPPAVSAAAKAAGSLIAHTALRPDSAFSGTLGSAVEKTGEAASKVPGAVTERLGLPETEISGFVEGYPVRESRGVAERITKAAKAVESQLETPPSERDRKDMPVATALHLTRPLRALGAAMEEGLPEYTAYKRWEARTPLSMRQKIDDVVAHGRKKDYATAEAIAPVEKSQQPLWRIAARAAIETGSDLISGLASLVPASPSELVELLAAGKLGAAVGRAGAEAAVRTAPEAALKAALPVTVKDLGAAAEGALRGQKVSPQSWAVADRLAQMNLERHFSTIQQTLGPEATHEAVSAATADVLKRSYEVMARKAYGLPMRGKMSAAPYEGPGLQPERRPTALEGPAAGQGAPARPPEPRPQPIDPEHVAATVAAAGVGGQASAELAAKYPWVYASAAGLADVPPLARAPYEKWASNARAVLGIPPGAVLDDAAIAAGVRTGKLNYLAMAALDKAIFEAAAREQGAHPKAMGRLHDDAVTAAQNPAAALVVEKAHKQSVEAFDKARGQATGEMMAHAAAEAKKLGAAADQAATGPAAAPAAPEAPPAVPSRSEAVASAQEAGMAPEDAHDAHRAAALAAHDAGTLDPAVAHEYATDGDTSFNPAELESEATPLPDMERHPSEMTKEELAAAFGLDPKTAAEVHREVTARAEEEVLEQNRRMLRDELRQAGVSPQPILDRLRKRPISMKAIRDLGLHGDFKDFLHLGVTAKKGGVLVDDAVTAAIEAGELPEGSTPNDLIEAIDRESRKGTRKEAEKSMVGESVPGSQYQQDPAPAFYSALERAVESKLSPKTTVEQVRAVLREAKADEVKWSGVEDFLKGKDKVDRGELLDYLRANRVSVTEVMKGGSPADANAAKDHNRLARITVRLDDISREVEKAGFEAYEEDYHNPGSVVVEKGGKVLEDSEIPESLRPLVQEMSSLYKEHDSISKGLGDEGEVKTKFSDYTLPGGENYRELLLTLPVDSSAARAQAEKTFGVQFDKLSNDEKNELYQTTPLKGKTFILSHFDEPNILAHVRFNDRVDADGKRILFLEEVQSDWGQKLRKSAALREVAKPQSIRKLAEDFLGREMASVMPLKAMDGGVLAALKHDEIKKAVVSSLPVDVVNNLATAKSTPDDLLSNPDVVMARLPANHCRSVSDGILSRAREVGASLRAKLLSALTRGGDRNLLPALSASDLTAREVVGLLAPESIYHDELLGPTTNGDVTKSGAESSTPTLPVAGKGPKSAMASGADFLKTRLTAREGTKSGSASTGLDPKLASASIADALNWHNEIVSKAGKSKRTRYEADTTPEMPLEKTWWQFSLKRMLRYAAENGYDKMAWTTGEQQADRYDLSKSISNIGYNGTDLKAWDKEGRMVVSRTGVRPEDLPDIIGKDAAEKIMAKGPERGKLAELEGLELKVGGEGMKGFYDKIVPDFLRKFGKKFGADVEETKIQTKVDGENDPYQTDNFEAVEGKDATVKVHAMPITPELKRAAMQEGFSLFDRPTAKAMKPGEYASAGAEGAGTGGPSLPAGQPGTSSEVPKPSTESLAQLAAKVNASNEGQIAFDFGAGGVEQYVAKVAAELETVRKEFPNFVAAAKAAEELKTRGKVSYIMKQCRTALDAAELFSAFRHPQLEHFQIILTKGGRVVAHPTITSGVVDMVKIPMEFKQDVAKMMVDLKADGYYLAHNHPSGNPTPSREDNVATAAMLQEFEKGAPSVKFKGHVVTDDTEFSVIGRTGTKRMQFRKPKQNYRPDAGNVIDNQNLAIDMLTREMSDKDKVGVILLDSRSRVLGFEQLPPDGSVHDRALASLHYFKASAMILGGPTKALFKLSESGTRFPKQLIDVIELGSKIGTRSWDIDGLLHRMVGEHSAYKVDYVTRVAEDEPRYMRADGMDRADLEAALKEKGVAPGSEVTARVPVGALKRGEKGKVVGIDRAGVRLLVRFGGEVSGTTITVRPENLIETYRKPAARAAVEAAAKAETKSGQPSQPIKRTVAQQQAGLASGTPVETDEMALLAEKFRNQAKGARVAAAETRRAMKVEFGKKMDAYRDKMDSLKADHAYSRKESLVLAKWAEATEREIRNQLTEYVQTNLPPAARGKFLDAVKNADTINKLGIAMERVDEAAALIHKKGVMSDIRKMVKRISDSPSVDIVSKKLADELMGDVELKGHAAATYARIRAMLEAVTRREAAGEDVAVTRAMAEEMDILGRRPLKDLSETELEQAYLRLQMLEEVGRTKVKVRESIYLLEKERVAKEVMSDLQPIKARQLKAPQGFKDLSAVDAVSNAIKEKLNQAYDKYMAITPPDVVWDMMSKTGQYLGAMVKHFAHGISADYARAIDMYDPPIDEARKMIEESKLTDEQIRRVTAYAYLRQPGGAEYLKNVAGLSTKDLAAAATLTKPEAALYSVWRKHLEAMHPLLADAIHFNDNLPLGKVPDYFPVRFDPGRALDAGEDLAKMIQGMHQGFQKNVAMGNIKPRLGSKRPVALNGQATFEGYMRLAAYKVTMSRRLRMLGEVVNSPEFAEGAGEFGTRFAKQFITMMARRGAPRANDVIPWMDAGRRNASVFAIVGRLPTAAVHLTLLTNAAAMSGPTHVFGAFRTYLKAQLTGDPRYEDYLRKNHPEYRLSHGNDPVFQDAAELAKWDSSDWWKAATSPTSLRYIVRAATAAALLGNEMKWLEQHGETFSFDRPNKDALDHAALMTRRAIASPELPHMFLAYNSGEVLTGSLSGNRALTQFHNFPLDRWSTYAHDLPEMVKRKNRAAAVNFVFWNTIGDLAEVGIRHGYKAALAALLAGAGLGAASVDDHHDGFWKEFMVKLLEKPPFVPDLINLGLYGRVPTTVFSMGSDAVSKAFKAGEAYRLADNRRALQNMTDSLFELSGLMLPIPGGGTIQQVLRMMLADRGVRFPFTDDRTRLNNLHKNGTATIDDEAARTRLNHAYARFERLNGTYKKAMARGDRQTAADILEAMKNVAKEAKP